MQNYPKKKSRIKHLPDIEYETEIMPNYTNEQKNKRTNLNRRKRNILREE